MEKLIADIEAYAAAAGLAPGTVVQYAARLNGKAFARWKAGGACTVATEQRIRAWMAAHPLEADA